MKRILYASGSVLTGDAIAHAVVNYARSLARAGSADMITIPVIKDERRETVEMLIGPSSQLILEDAGADPESAFDDPSFQQEIDSKRAQMDNPPTISPRGRAVAPNSLLDDY